MRRSRYFMPILRENPTEAEIVSHRLMLRAGMIRQSSAGIYSWLPLGHRVLTRIEQIVREEMNAIGGQEFLLPAVHPAEIWQKSGRWEVAPSGSRRAAAYERPSRCCCGRGGRPAASRIVG